MPLIPQQAILTATSSDIKLAEQEIHKQLEDYPDCRIISLSSFASSVHGNEKTIVVVVETV